MCEDCNVTYPAGLSALYFDSCVCEDCSSIVCKTLSANFDSCMREDCNKPRVSGGGASFILIHACAKIATDGGGAVSVADVVLIHACAKIAT